MLASSAEYWLSSATGVDLDGLLQCAADLPQLVGHDVPGQVAKAGRPQDLHPAPPLKAA